MPVNTAALKSFAPAMRRQLLEAVGRKLDLLLNSQTPDTLSTYARQIAELREREAENREQLLERVAYTWFNRLCALRYLDARGWHPFGCKVLMPAAEGETQPELLKLMRAGNLPAGLKGHSDESRLHGLLDGQIQPAIASADPQGEVYRELVLATCRFYHALLPNLFEALDDATELLLPDDLLTEGSCAGAFRSEISDDDCQDVEIIGWLYQFYISEKKDEVMARKKAVVTEDIPAVTQLFTPHWIVRYLVENSLGRLWLQNRPSSKLREHMPYYIEGETEADFLVINKPEEIKLLDPACGSGHMLTYAFDLLTQIYEEEGYSVSEIPGLILQHNLHGLEICPRAAQLAEIALIFKAREKSRRFFQPEQLVPPKIVELKDVELEPAELIDYLETSGLGGPASTSLFKLVSQFEEVKDLGALIQPCYGASTLEDMRESVANSGTDRSLIHSRTRHKILHLLDQAEALRQKYHVCVANPPYMGIRGMNAITKDFLQDQFKDYKTDLFAAFFVRSLTLAKQNGFIGFMSPFVWMFISSYEKLRARLTGDATITSLVQLEYSGFEGATVPVCTFTLANKSAPQFQGGFVRLTDFRGAENQGPKTLEAIANPQCGWFFRATAADFRRLPGAPIAYWIGKRFASTFDGKPLGNEIETEGQNKTADNARFLRKWWELSLRKIGKYEKWVPYAKGGDFRKWYGNIDSVVDWSVEAREHYRNSLSCRIVDKRFWFREGVTWTDITSSGTAFRLMPEGGTFDMTGPAAFFGNPEKTRVYLALLNTCVVFSILPVLNPTLHLQLRDVKSIPLPKEPLGSHPARLAESAIAISRDDWDSFETSMDFLEMPLLRTSLTASSLSKSWQGWKVNCDAKVRQMQEIETNNNQLFIAAYGLEGELQPEVPEEEITLARADLRTDIEAFLSYATGCMMGRYSLNRLGLILADSRNSQDEHLTAYAEKVGQAISEVQFKPDPDGIIPVLDGEWFEDDIVARTREFLAVTFPESSVAENLRFIEESLGKDIRKYFCSDFYKDHLQTYKKRPIYWMVQSPKKGFACLIYLHRYTKDTLNQVLNNYFRPYLQKLEARLAQLEQDQINDDLKSRVRNAARKEAEKITKVLKECQAWEQDALLPLAQQRIELDLDDGVKVNYLKLQDVLATIPGLASKED